jgi:cytidylate kinase
MIVAIDGPAASGKSSTAKAVARRLGFRHLDSGAFYRALTLAALRAGIPRERWNGLSDEELDALRVASHPGDDGFRFTIAGTDVTDSIRSDDVNAAVSHMARVPAVREWLFGRLRAAATTDLVADGRDMGTVVFPDADVKVFITAAPEERARRRLLERGVQNPDGGAVASETDRLVERDRLDTERETSPLRRAPDAVLIDTSGLDFEAQVARVVGLVRARQRVDGQQPDR